MLRQIREFLSLGESGERRLISAAQHGDQEAFDGLLRLHEASLRGFLLSRIGGQAIEDVLQEIRIAAWQSFPRFGGRSRFKTWLFGIARYKCTDHYRSASHQAMETSLPETTGGELADPQDAYDTVDARLWATALLDSLPPEQKEVMELYYYGELTLAEIATVLGRNINTVKAQFYRAHLRASAQARATSRHSTVVPSSPRSGGAWQP